MVPEKPEDAILEVLSSINFPPLAQIIV